MYDITTQSLYNKKSFVYQYIMNPAPKKIVANPIKVWNDCTVLAS